MYILKLSRHNSPLSSSSTLFFPSPFYSPPLTSFPHSSPPHPLPLTSPSYRVQYSQLSECVLKVLPPPRVADGHKRLHDQVTSLDCSGTDKINTCTVYVRTYVCMCVHTYVCTYIYKVTAFTIQYDSSPVTNVNIIGYRNIDKNPILVQEYAHL